MNITGIKQTPSLVKRSRPAELMKNSGPTRRRRPSPRETSSVYAAIDRVRREPLFSTFCVRYDATPEGRSAWAGPLLWHSVVRFVTFFLSDDYKYLNLKMFKFKNCTY
jgi:hypothetical protein